MVNFSPVFTISVSNLSCKLEIFDEILLPPVELINRLEKKRKRKLLFLLSVLLKYRIKQNFQEYPACVFLSEAGQTDGK